MNSADDTTAPGGFKMPQKKPSPKIKKKVREQQFEELCAQGANPSAGTCSLSSRATLSKSWLPSMEVRAM